MAAVTRIMKHELRIMVFVLFMILASLFIIRPVYAASSASSASPSALPISSSIPYTLYPIPSYVSPTSPLYTDLLVNNLFHSFSCLAIGQSMIGQPCLSYQITQNAQGYLQGVPVLSQVNTSGGALGATTSLIGALYQNPPVRTADYLASLGEGMGLVKTANAQVVGSGAAVLNPILRLWQVSRNISYVIMIIIFMVIGLMVMFRNKINPQTVITAQAALPGLVIGLILITFSYFLAGLISDMAFVGTNVVGYYFTTAQEKPPENLAQKLSDSNILNIMGSMAGIIHSDGDNGVATFVGTIFESLGGPAQGAVRWLVFWISAQFASNIVPNDLLAASEKFSPWSLLIKPIAGIGIGITTSLIGISPLLGQLLTFAAALALVYAMLKLFFKLITAWLTIIFLTITAPFQFLIASLPGRQGMATGWMLSILGNILIFPAVIAVIFFAAFLVSSEDCPKDNKKKCLIQVSASNPHDNSSFIKPAYADGINIVGSDTFPLFGGINLNFMRILLAFGALMALPAIPDIITRTVGKAGQAGQMMGQEIMGNARFGQGYSQRSFQGGLALGQQGFTGLTGETQVDYLGNLKVVRGGVLRPVPGDVPVGKSKYARPGKFFWQK